MKRSESILKIAPALLNAQRQMGTASKDAKNPFYKSFYADLNAIREAVIPALHSNGISALQPIIVIEGKNYVETTFLHESGESLSSETEIVCAKQNDPQAFGAAVSYTRRYALQSFMNVGAEDGDAEAAMDRNNKKETEAKKTEVLAKKEESAEAKPKGFRLPAKKTESPATTAVEEIQF